MIAIHHVDRVFEAAPSARSSARDVAPDDVAPARTPLPPRRDHALLLGGHEIEQGIAAHVHAAMRLEQRLEPWSPQTTFWHGFWGNKLRYTFSGD